MASSNLKRLQDRAAAVAARLNELADIEERSEDQTVELRKLTEEADKVQSDLEFEQKLAAKEAELRSVVERAAPAKAAPEAAPEAPKAEEKVEIRHVLPHHTELRAFNGSEADVRSAYGIGRWLRGTIFRNADDLRWCKDHGFESRALNEGTASAGGYLVPDEFAARVIRLVETYGTMPGACERVTLARDVMNIPKRATGTTAYFVGEGSAITESDPSFTQVQLNAVKLAVATRLSSEVLEDSASYVNIADQVTIEFGQSLAFKIDSVGWNGAGTSGDGSITGITAAIDDGTHTASVVDAAAGNTSFETLDVDDFLTMIGKLPIYARSGARFYVSPAGYAASIARLKYALGGNAVGDLSGDAGMTFLGYPVTLVHVLDSTLGADAGAVKVLFGNLGLSSIYASRREFSMKTYDQVYAVNEQLLMQGSMRFTIKHHSLGSNAEVGPVVALKTAAS
jgi:HK97 family phage major capsid protein